MGCFASVLQPVVPSDMARASRETLWNYLSEVSAETGYRLYHEFDTGNAAAQGQSAQEAADELYRRFYSLVGESGWQTLEDEIRRRKLHNVWLYRVADDAGKVLVLLGSESQAKEKRALHTVAAPFEQIK